MAASDAVPVPRKNTAYRVTFAIFDADGDLVTGATGLDSEVSKDGGTFADCTNEATEIATSSGMYYLDLTSTEMDADTVAVIVKTSTSGAKTTPIVLYPEEAGDIRVNTVQVGGTSQTARDLGAQLDAAVSTRSTYAGGDTSGTTTLLDRLTSTRAAYLDKLNITGNVASSGEVTNIQNNTRMVFVVPEQIIRPSSGTTANYVRLYLYDSVGNMEAPDSAPEMELRNVAGTDLSARLTSTTGALESTGVYRWEYTSDPAHALEQILWSVTVVEGGATRKNGRTSWIAETYTTDFTSSDRTTLNTIAGYVDSIPADVRTELATELARIDVATSTRLAASSYTAPLDAAGTRSAIGLASANLDTQLAALPTATENADALLARNHEGGSNGGRTVSQSFGAVRNKVAFDVPAAGQFTVYAADDSTPLYTGTYTATSGANPVTAIDPS